MPGTINKIKPKQTNKITNNPKIKEFMKLSNSLKASKICNISVFSAFREIESEKIAAPNPIGPAISKATNGGSMLNKKSVLYEITVNGNKLEKTPPKLIIKK